ncbi:(2,3-dihydroxybenzoyl)adenylate synthase [Nitriliruptor alkaliphilus]|uniref:(2,3-dihydroxybenzoyl)adenylate synthase n=1 Tax=Nitriliruptor alkaliphilus TaxID=427918 RepID=UPI000A665276|nr:AMP-binding protein [Nitriliruptor alkaliphilus]
MLDGCVEWPAELQERYQQADLWRGDTLGGLLRFWAVSNANRTAIVCDDRRLTYAELDRTVDRAALGFRALGLERGDRVVLHLPNVPEFLVAAFALFRLGMVPVFALPAHREHEIGYFCDHAGAVAYVGAVGPKAFDPRRLGDRLADPARPLRSVVVVGADDAAREAGFVPFERLLAEPSAAADAAGDLDAGAPDPSEVAFFLLSGGTTGLPKLIPRTHDDYSYNVRCAADVCGFTRDTVYLVALPISHNFPFGCPGALAALSVGGRVVLTSDPAPAAVFPLIEREGVTVTALVPALALRWVEDAAQIDADLSSLEVLQVGGAKLVPELARRIGPALGCAVQQVFGMAEGLLNFTRLDDPDEITFTTQGRPMSPADEVAVVDEHGDPVAPGEPGELITQGPYTLRGYYRAEEHNARAFTPAGWYRSGDIVRQDADGNLVVEGRAKDLINRGGEKISAEEVEDLLLAHPAVRNVAAVAMPDRVLGERTCVYVIVRDGHTLALEDLTGELERRGVAKYKWPERLEVVDELPTTNVGKIDKRALREDVLRRLEAATAP